MNPESARPAEKGVPDAAPVRKLLQAFESLSREGADEPKLFQEIHSLYRNLSEEEKEPLFAAMIQEIEVSKDGLGGILEKLLSSDPRDPRWPLWISELRNCIRSPRLHILRKISHQPGGLKFLLDLRGDVLSVQRFSSAELTPLDMDLVLLFELWFQDGFLYLEEITFDSSYRQIELIKNSDLVHPMTGIEEMGKRLGRDLKAFRPLPQAHALRTGGLHRGRPDARHREDHLRDHPSRCGACRSGRARHGDLLLHQQHPAGVVGASPREDAHLPGGRLPEGEGNKSRPLRR